MKQDSAIIIQESLFSKLDDLEGAKEALVAIVVVIRSEGNRQLMAH